MFKVEGLIFLLFCFAATFTVVFGMGDMGEGRWSLLSVGSCEDDELEDVQPKCAIDVTRRKHNRTLDVFDVTIDCEEDVDDTYGALIVICKHVDGGCKEWQVLSDDSLPRFGKKYAEDNVRRAMEMAQIDPPEFPIIAGEHSITGFQMNYCEFPTDCVYGTFTALAFLVREGVKVACVKAVVQFDEDMEGYECE